MKTIETHEEYVPTWAVCYIVNGDGNDDFSDEDQDLVDTWMTEHEQAATALGAHVVYDCTGETEDFTWRPAFGLACNVELVRVHYMTA